MVTDNSLIVGERNPMVGGKYTYTLRVPCVTERWEIWRGNHCLAKKDKGEFTFQDASLGEGFVIRAYYKTVAAPLTLQLASIAVKTYPGKPQFVTISWQDANLEDLNGKAVAYLDDVYLAVRTANIPKGDRLTVQIIDQTPLSDGPKMYAYVDEHSVARFKVSPELLRFLAQKTNSANSLYNRIHYYRAKIEYFREEIPTVEQITKDKKYIQINETTELLCVTNVAGQAIPPKNGDMPAVVEKDKIDGKRKDSVKIKLNVFFDGTKNNRTNVEIGKRVTHTEDKDLLPENSREPSEEDKKTYKKHGGGDDSYDQGYSNVAILQWCDDFKKEKKEISIYIEGVGTRDLYGDVTYGLALGMGATGIKAKVEKALNQILEKRKGVVNINKETVVEAKVNVFGFSRGAATARHFVSTKRSEVALQLTTSKINVIFKFVGLFDTVSAHGLGHHDTAELSLDMGGKPMKVLQLKALDESRANFSLTDITSSIQAGVGYELGLPGAHSDIGGGYKNEEPEIVTMAPESLVDRLIKEGWHIEKSKIKEGVSYDYMPSPTGGAVFKSPVLYGIKRIVRNEYQYIPLKIMENFAHRYGSINFIESKLKKYYDKVEKAIAYDKDLKELEKALVYYRDKFVPEADSKNGAHSINVDELSEDKKNILRHNFIHLSAFQEGGQAGMGDYIANHGRYEKGLPKREIIPG